MKPQTDNQQDRISQRKLIRHARRQICRQQQRLHQLSVLNHLKRSSLLKRHQRFAIYLHADGELNTDLIIDYLLTLNKQVFLPVLHPLKPNRLWFVPFNHQTRLKKNRFNILEPANIQQRVNIISLQVVLMPLVAFDLHGNRLGMGGGFYDRTFSALKNKAHIRLPKLIGLAHELQKLPVISAQTWDISLHAVISNKIFYRI